MYTISANSTEIAIKIREYYNNILNVETLCKATAERKYVENTEKQYEGLQECLSANSVPSEK